MRVSQVVAEEVVVAEELPRLGARELEKREGWELSRPLSAMRATTEQVFS
jgi:hypothetical protein